MLRKNVVLEPGLDGPFDAPHRVLWCDRTDVVLIRLTPPIGKPFFADTSQVEGWLDGKTLKVGSFALPSHIKPDNEVPTTYVEKRDQLWAIIQPLVTGINESIIFSAGDRWRLVEARAREVHRTPTYVYSLLQRYWLYGQMPNALMPAYGNCGAAGKLRKANDRKRGRRRDVVLSGHDPSAVGVNVTAQDLVYIAKSIKVFHLRQGKSLAESRTEMINRYYSEPRLIDDEVVRVPKRDADLIQLPAYRYWANKLLSNTSLQHEVLSESFWQKRMHARANHAWETTIGPADIFEIDATVGNFYLVSELNPKHLIGRPVIYFVICRRSSMIVGLHIGLEGPSWNAARFALYSAFTNKVALCRKYGVEIREEEWPAQELCNIIVADNAELLSDNAERSLQNYLNLDCEINPIGIPVGKGSVESKFFCVLERVSWVPGAWKARAAEHDARNDLDLRWDAKLTLRDLTQILIEEVLEHNNHQRVEELRTQAMIQADVPPYRRDIYLWGLENESGESARYPDPEALRRCLLPSKMCSLTERGLEVDGACYLPKEGDVETLLASARRRRRRFRVHYDTHADDEVYVFDEQNRAWSDWKLSGTSSERYARMRHEEILELQASIRFAAHDAKDEENQAQARKKTHQNAIVARAKKARAKAGAIDSKQEYLGYQAKNRAHEILVERSLEAITRRQTDATMQSEKPPDPIDMTIDRRNNVVALLRARNRKNGEPS